MYVWKLLEKIFEEKIRGKVSTSQGTELTL